jgi:hypothetical protein
MERSAPHREIRIRPIVLRRCVSLRLAPTFVAEWIIDPCARTLWSNSAVAISFAPAMAVDVVPESRRFKSAHGIH